MKRILITGANSYVGTSVEKWLIKDPNNYHVETLDMQNPSWVTFDFSKFDVVFHVAGIAHVSKKKSMEDLYYKVNRDLTIQTAQIAKSSGVKQFIFMSSMIVYNSKDTKITLETIPKPDNFYGMSKLLAEEGLLTLWSDEFSVCILRPPMIYGPNSKGNFPKLIKIAKKTLVFPYIENKRSMLHIDNLSIFIKNAINDTKAGLYFPQNKEYSCTTSIIKKIANINNRRIWFTKLLNPLIFLFKNRINIINKVFGDFYYDINKDVLDSFISLDDSLLDIERAKTDE